MNTQSAQTPIQRESITITLTPDELETIVFALGELSDYTAIYNKLQFLLPKSGDACRHPVQSPDAVGQDGTICYQCEKTVNYLFADGRGKCCTRLTQQEIEGQGDTHD